MIEAGGKKHDRYPSFGGDLQIQDNFNQDNNDGQEEDQENDDSIQLSEKGSIDKFKSIEVVK
jgi:hypothetical protein